MIHEGSFQGPPSHIPCKSCPWRRETPTDGSTIPGFDIDLLRDLEGTTEPGWSGIMACHLSDPGEQREWICIGYLYRDGYHNLSVRLYLSKTGLKMKDVDAACNGLDLYQNYQEMLEYFLEGEV